MSKAAHKTPLPLASWIVFCAFLNCAGWVLSGLHQLNVLGYTVALAAGIFAFGIWWRQSGRSIAPGHKLTKLRGRFRRSFPLAFLALATLACLGGALHAPNNYDGLAYRIPRMLNWLAEGRWHWIYTDFPRLNTRGCGIEWISTPLIAFTKSDRTLFLINVVSFLFLPGLVFSVFTRLGVKPRTAWHWMWLAPSGYCFLLQAGGMANDMFGSVFALAALDFALRARKSGRISEVCLSILAAALLTSSKASNLPLLLPWLFAFLPTWRIWLAKPLALGAIALPAMGASLMPTAILNQLNCGDWTGLKAEPALIGHGPAWLHVMNNGIMYVLENIVPPVFPFASAWNHLMDKSIPASLAALLQKSFEPEAAHWHLGEMQIEEGAGLGFGVTLVFALSVIAAGFQWLRRSKSPSTPSQVPLLSRLVCVLPWVSLLYVMSKMGLSGGARYLTPYYLLLMMGWLCGDVHARLVRYKWWRGGAYGAFALTALLVVISPARPLWPVGWFARHYGVRLQASRMGTRAMTVYEVYGGRAEAFAPAVRVLPKDATLLGLVTADDPETSLWLPFGSRRILHVRVTDSGDQIRQRGIKYVLVHEEKLQEPWQQWLARVDGRVLQTLDLRLRAARDASLWYLIELNPHAGQKSEASLQPRSRVGFDARASF